MIWAKMDTGLSSWVGIIATMMDGFAGSFWWAIEKEGRVRVSGLRLRTYLCNKAVNRGYGVYCQKPRSYGMGIPRTSYYRRSSVPGCG